MAPGILFCFVIGYFIVLLVIGYLTSKRSSDNETFFIANRNSKWYLVAFGMIGTTISGITFISVPGTVNHDAFSYFQFVLGNAVGYVIISMVLMPLYYRMQLTSIYTYLEHRFGFWSYKTGAFFFLISRVVGSAFRLFLVAIVLQHFIFDAWNIPFWVTVTVTILLIWTYTFRGGLKTIIITDTIQTAFLLISVLLSIYFISKAMHLDIGGLFNKVKNSRYSKIFYMDNMLADKRFFFKYFLGGIGVTVAMSGLDQDLMQKNLSCRNLREAKINMFSFTGVFVLINIFFLTVGALLYIYAQAEHIPIPARSDYVFPEIVFHHLGTLPAVGFILGLTAATFATTDSALTALTTSFCVDFLGMGKKLTKSENSLKLERTRKRVHVTFSVVILLVVVGFKYVVNESIVKAIFTVASFTYGPLLGIFFFGILTKRTVHDKWVPVICVLSPLVCWLLDVNSRAWFGGYVFGFELLIVNGLITFLGMIAIIKRDKTINLL
ncbi:MAG TPA: sodium:solute symporter [Hanamia sp.]|nr:sodium:solute symporter [Hanamia sp.]